MMRQDVGRRLDRIEQHLGGGQWQDIVRELPHGALKLLEMRLKAAIANPRNVPGQPTTDAELAARLTAFRDEYLAANQSPKVPE